MLCNHKSMCGNCERELEACRADPCTMTYPVCRLCALDVKFVFQDGRDFYVGTEDETEHTVTAPMRVADFDMVAAANARDWFVKVWAPMNGIAPRFTEESN